MTMYINDHDFTLCVGCKPGAPSSVDAPTETAGIVPTNQNIDESKCQKHHHLTVSCMSDIFSIL